MLSPLGRLQGLDAVYGRPRWGGTRGRKFFKKMFRCWPAASLSATRRKAIGRAVPLTSEEPKQPGAAKPPQALHPAWPARVVGAGRPRRGAGVGRAAVAPILALRTQFFLTAPPRARPWQGEFGNGRRLGGRNPGPPVAPTLAGAFIPPVRPRGPHIASKNIVLRISRCTLPRQATPARCHDEFQARHPPPRRLARHDGLDPAQVGMRTTPSAKRRRVRDRGPSASGELAPYRGREASTLPGERHRRPAQTAPDPRVSEQQIATLPIGLEPRRACWRGAPQRHRMHPSQLGAQRRPGGRARDRHRPTGRTACRLVWRSLRAHQTRRGGA